MGGTIYRTNIIKAATEFRANLIDDRKIHGRLTEHKIRSFQVVDNADVGCSGINSDGILSKIPFHKFRLGSAEIYFDGGYLADGDQHRTRGRGADVDGE